MGRTKRRRMQEAILLQILTVIGWDFFCPERRQGRSLGRTIYCLVSSEKTLLAYLWAYALGRSEIRSSWLAERGRLSIYI